MILTKGKSNLRVLSVVLACLVVGGALFGSGYWLGQRSLQSQLKTLANQAVNPTRPPMNPWAGVNAAHPMPGANIPANATPEMKEFMQTRVNTDAWIVTDMVKAPHHPIALIDPERRVTHKEASPMPPNPN